MQHPRRPRPHPRRLQTRRPRFLLLQAFVAEEHARPEKPACRITELPVRAARSFTIASFRAGEVPRMMVALRENVARQFPTGQATFVNKLYVYLAKPLFGESDGTCIFGNVLEITLPNACVWNARRNAVESVARFSQ